MIFLSLLGEGFLILFIFDLILLLWFIYFYCILFLNLRNVFKILIREWVDRLCIIKGYIYIIINMFSGCFFINFSVFLVWNFILNRNLEVSFVLIIVRFFMFCV